MFGWKKNVTPIGIDVGTHAVHMLQLKAEGEGWALAAAARVELDSLPRLESPAEMALSAVRVGLKTGRFVGRQFVLSLPSTHVQAKNIRLPQMPDAELEQAALWEAKDRFGADLDDGRIAWFRAGEIRRGNEAKDEVLLFAVTGQTLRDYLAAMASAGLSCAAIDLPACALWRATQRIASGAGEGVTALFDLGHHGSQFLICRDNEPVFYKYIDIGGKTLTAAVAQKLNMPTAEAAALRQRVSAPGAADDAETAPLEQAVFDAMRPALENLAQELDMCMRYFVVTFRGARPETILAAGRQASAARVCEALSNSLGLPVEPVQALRGVAGLNELTRPDRASEWTLATGLTLYPLGRKSPMVAPAPVAVGGAA